jgi:hypothetical protein
MACTALLTDPRFILEIKRDPLVRMRGRDASQRGRQLLF